MPTKIDKYYNIKIQNLKKEGLFKEEKTILSKQSNIVRTTFSNKMINFC